MISVIIPVLNEADGIVKQLQYLKKTAGNDVELLVVNGGSTDQTHELAIAEAARVIESPKGRAKQMNNGAKAANGEILYFLHADTIPPETWYSDIMNAVEKGFDAGCCQLSFDYNHPALKFYAWFTRFDVDMFRFGDQSLFVTRKLFRKTHGFDEKLIVMEDQEFVKTLKKSGAFVILNSKVTTSARKYRKVGVYKLQLIFTVVLTMYYLGIDQQKIVDFYFARIQ
ncbi:MAG: TIGR04283 family arsenosugar biosynthesis glycosyltransferase [Balneolaceae bacterium]|nr:TIGR04283 family arsenosugar biosynthesis glycosyltransferase [Balneolaceae bacterium]